MIGFWLCSCTVGLLLIHWANHVARRCRSDHVSSSAVWVGISEYRWFPRVRAALNSVLRNERHLKEGLRKFLSRNQAFALPNLFTGADIILPHKHMDWLLAQPSEKMSQREANRRFLEADYTMLHPIIQETTVHEKIIRRDLPRNLELLTATLVEDLTQGWKQWWTNSEEWHSVDIFHTACQVMYRSSNRVFVGTPLCHDPQYLMHNQRLFQYILPVAGLINLTPALLKPIFGRLLTLYDKYQYWQCSRKTVPLIRQRIAQFGDRILQNDIDDDAPNDYIQWALRDVLPRGIPDECRPEVMAKRLATLQWAGQISSIMALTNILLDLASVPGSADVWAKLRAEVETTLESEGGWSKRALVKMRFVESAIKESLRLGGITGRGVSKVVMHPEGIRLPDGTWAPQGTQVGISSYTTHRDPELYPDPWNYDPFRFVDSVEFTGRCPRADSGAPLNRTSATYLAFSHGVNSCPGRFFASYQVKLHLANLLLYYDIEPIPSRKPHVWFQNATGPPMTEQLRVRRRPARSDGKDACIGMAKV